MIDISVGERQARTRSWMSSGQFLGEPPVVNPLDRGQVPAADSYQPGDAVWVFRHGVWNPGTVRSSSRVAVLVDYHRPGGGGVLTDTVADLYVMPRDQPDPLLDRGRAG